MNAKEQIEEAIKTISKEKDSKSAQYDQAVKDIAEITRYYNQSFKFLEAHQLRKRDVLDSPLGELGTKYAQWELKRQELELGIKAYQERLNLAGQKRDKLHQEVLDLGVALGSQIENLRHVRLQSAGGFLARP